MGRSKTQDNKFTNMSIRTVTLKELDKQRERMAKAKGVEKISWDNLVSKFPTLLRNMTEEQLRDL